MNTLLLATTIFASAVALAASIALFMAFRDERRRSRARVAALQQLAGPPAPNWDDDVQSIDVADFLTAADATAARPMFSGSTVATPWGRRLASAAAVAVVAAIAGYF
jgi:hypothetical protein